MKTYYRSKHKFPTRVIRNGNDGVLSIGHKRAKEDIERTLGRRLHPDTKVRTCGGNWRFREP